MSGDFEGRDLRGESLRERNLAGARLHGADLRGVDLRGADLSGADLSSADLRGVRTGLATRWTWVLIPSALLVSLGCGVATGYAGRLLAGAFGSRLLAMRSMGVFVAAALALFLAVTVIRGLRVATARVLPAELLLIALVGVAAVATGAGTGHAALLGLSFLLAVGLLVVLAIGARAVSGTAGNAAFTLVALSGAAIGAVLGGGLVAAFIAIAALLASQRALHGAEGFPVLEQALARVATRGGTNLREADLRGARLDRARFFATDLRYAKLDPAQLGAADVRLCLVDEALREAMGHRHGRRRSERLHEA
jgi:uncharacterized protein YjbI with pentapeptide repeats